MVENFEDLQKQVQEAPKVQTNFVPRPNNQKGNQAPSKNLWTDNNIKALPLNIIEKKYGNKAFSVYFNSLSTDIPQDVISRITNAVAFLSKSGYTLRAWYPGESELGKTIVKSFLSDTNQKLEWYLPSKKYNENVITPTSLTRNELAFQLVRGFHKGWDKIAGFVRALCARDMEVLLGKDCKHPLQFILIYSPCGSETLPENPNYQQLGQLSYILRLAKELSIPVFNLKNEEVGKRLVELINGKQPEAQPAQQPTQPVQAQPQEVVVTEPNEVKVEQEPAQTVEVQPTVTPTPVEQTPAPVAQEQVVQEPVQEKPADDISDLLG